MPLTRAPLSRTLVALRAALLVIILGALVLTGCGGSSGTTAITATTGRTGTPTAESPGSSFTGGRPTPTPADAAKLAPATPVSSLPTMLVSQLPEQGVDTLRLIADGGPFPYHQDGVTFSNREGILPQHPSGWYHEYTVITPGSSDRGARRIIGGRDGGRFYTDDHYASFREVLSGVSS